VNIPQLYVQILSKDLPAEEKKVKGIAMTIAPIMPPAIMKNTSLLNEKSTLASWGFILLTISTSKLVNNRFFLNSSYYLAVCPSDDDDDDDDDAAPP